MTRIVLCADDYGQNSAISQAIVELLRAKHLSATSCITTTSTWPEASKYLEPFKDKADIGLHLNLTQGKSLSGAFEFAPVNNLIVNAYTRKIEKAPILTEFTAQLDKFVECFGQLPDFVDGHHHIQQLPIIRDALFEIYTKRLEQNNTYVRCTYDPASLFRVRSPAYFKQLIIQLTGGITFRSELIKRGIPHNNSFAGFYNFSYSYEYSETFPRFVKQVRDGGIIMCHPSLMSSEEEDPIVISRHNEYLYFSDKKYVRLCNNYPIELCRFRDIPQK